MAKIKYKKRYRNDQMVDVNDDQILSPWKLRTQAVHHEKNRLSLTGRPGSAFSIGFFGNSKRGRNYIAFEGDKIFISFKGRFYPVVTAHDWSNLLDLCADCAQPLRAFFDVDGVEKTAVIGEVQYVSNKVSKITFKRGLLFIKDGVRTINIVEARPSHDLFNSPNKIALVAIVPCTSIF